MDISELKAAAAKAAAAVAEIAPKVEVHEDSSGRRVYETKGKRYVSVTTILEATYPRPHLAGWGASVVAREAIAGRHIGMGEKEAYSYLQRSPYREMRRKADRGRDIHAQIEGTLQPALEGRTPVWWKDPNLEGYLDGARAFCTDYLSEVLALECKVFSDAHSYAGSADMWARSNREGGEVLLVEWKTGKRIHPDHALQLAAYAGADWMVDSQGNVRRMARPAAAAVVRLDEKGGYEARFLSPLKLDAYFTKFVRLVEMKKFLDLGDETWDATRKGCRRRLTLKLRRYRKKMRLTPLYRRRLIDTRRRLIGGR